MIHWSLFILAASATRIIVFHPRPALFADDRILLSSHSKKFHVVDTKNTRHYKNQGHVIKDAHVHAAGKVPMYLDMLDGTIDQTYAPGNTGSLGNVFVLDSGCDLQHPLLVGINTGPSFTGIDADHDYYGHGTHVAGIVRQVSPGANITCVAVFDASGSGKVSWILSAIEWVADTCSKRCIVNLSGGTYDVGSTLDFIAKTLNKRGVIVAAAGNGYGRDACTYWPARVPGVVGVGATNTYDGKLSYFSNIGPCVDVVAPGVSIVSSTPGNDYQPNSGTSMSTAFISGILAQVWTAYSFENDVFSKLEYNAERTALAHYPFPITPREPIADMVASGNGYVHWDEKLNAACIRVTTASRDLRTFLMAWADSTTPIRNVDAPNTYMDIRANANRGVVRVNDVIVAEGYTPFDSDVFQIEHDDSGIRLGVVDPLTKVAHSFLYFGTNVDRKHASFGALTRVAYSNAEYCTSGGMKPTNIKATLCSKRPKTECNFICAWWNEACVSRIS